MLPHLRLNAGFAHSLPAEGNIAFISQSGAIVGAISDWAASRNIGFSAMISVGDMADVDVGDLLDYFAADSQTQAVLLYLEQSYAGEEVYVGSSEAQPESSP
jgi:acetyltransferase